MFHCTLLLIISSSSAFDGSRFSLRPPFLQGMNDGVDTWSTHGSTVITNDAIKLTPLERDKKGSIWSHYVNMLPNWEANFQIAIGGGPRNGADGFVFWYTQTPNTIGNVYGSMDKWNGLGIIFDTYDNDGKGNNPYILAMVNDGTKAYDHDTDGLTQELAGAEVGFRLTSPDTDDPVHVRVIYENGALWVQTTVPIRGKKHKIDEGGYKTSKAMVKGQEQTLYTVLLVENVHLPTGYYFGFSAATGDVSDQHGLIMVDITTPIHHIPIQDSATKDSKQSSVTTMSSEHTYHYQPSSSPTPTQTPTQTSTQTPSTQIPPVSTEGDNSIDSVLSVLSRLEEKAVSLHTRLASITISNAPPDPSTSTSTSSPSSSAFIVRSDFDSLAQSLKAEVKQASSNVQTQVQQNLASLVPSALSSPSTSSTIQSRLIPPPPTSPATKAGKDGDDRILTATFLEQTHTQLAKDTHQRVEQMQRDVIADIKEKMKGLGGKVSERVQKKLSDLKKEVLADIGTISRDYGHLKESMLVVERKIVRSAKSNTSYVTLSFFIIAQFALFAAIIFSRKTNEKINAAKSYY